ncbi:hypothetical protein BUALT_Bualt03G0139600 [Buddleja alternifolia]|uniref:Zinc finger, GRF-type n=1 Tax=Buddleja alternifolia TaxID=168488 RepID=A0AAV6XUR2_9LAMI|nr:hypothetical protein BUALT_Bualt03G0139600 [Buddleja alternifolia]
MERNCYCARPAIRKTSWTDLNPGRRYIICDKFWEPGECNFFEFTNPPMCERSRQIIPGLLRRVNRLEHELGEKKSQEWWMWVVVAACLFVMYCMI